MKLVLQLGLYGASAAAAQRISLRGARIALTVLVLALTALGAAVLLDALQRRSRPMPGSPRGSPTPSRPISPSATSPRATMSSCLFFWCAAVRAAEMRWQVA